MTAPTMSTKGADATAVAGAVWALRDAYATGEGYVIINQHPVNNVDLVERIVDSVRDRIVDADTYVIELIIAHTVHGTRVIAPNLERDKVAIADDTLSVLVTARLTSAVYPNTAPLIAGGVIDGAMSQIQTTIDKYGPGKMPVLPVLISVDAVDFRHDR